MSRLRDKVRPSVRLFSFTQYSPNFKSDSFDTCIDCCIITRIYPIKIKKIRETLWEKGPFNFFLAYAIKTMLFGPILLKLAQIVFIIVRFNPIENKDNPSNNMEKGPYHLYVSFTR